MRTFPGLLCALVAVAACGDSGSSTSTDPPPGAAPTTTVAIATTATTVPATTVTSVVTSVPPDIGGVAAPDLPEPLPGGDGASGSGCAPGPGGLPDGAWFGFLGDHDATSFEFDLACVYFGEAAWAKAAEQGEEAPNDVWIGNDNDLVRTVELNSATPVTWILDITSETGYAVTPYADWVDDPSGYSNCPGDFCAVWVHVDGGEVTEIVEQYLP